MAGYFVKILILHVLLFPCPLPLFKQVSRPPYFCEAKSKSCLETTWALTVFWNEKGGKRQECLWKWGEREIPQDLEVWSPKVEWAAKSSVLLCDRAQDGGKTSKEKAAPGCWGCQIHSFDSRFLSSKGSKGILESSGQREDGINRNLNSKSMWTDN